MTRNTKRSLILIALLAAAAWFFLLRGRAAALLGQLPDSQPATWPGAVDALEQIEPQLQGSPYQPAQLKAQFGQLLSDEQSQAAPPAASDQQVGERQGFWISDEALGETQRITATLQHASDLLLMYVDEDVEIEQADLAAAAQDFETRIYPRTHQLFGGEASPGIDGDPRLTILHTPLESAGGYYSSADAEPQSINRFSNQREMFVIGSNSYLPGETDYLMILAHEFQHMIHDHQQPASPAWFNEGLSMLSQDMNGFPDEELAQLYLDDPDKSLSDWAKDAAITGEHYGAAQLFLRYFLLHYGGNGLIKELLEQDAGTHPQVFAQIAARKHADIQDFADLLADWAVANLLNDASVGDGRYVYESLPGTAALQELPSDGSFASTVSQLGVDNIGVLEGPLQMEFDGADAASLTGVQPQAGEWMWWSGRGDGRVATLTRSFDLRSVQQAELRFATWYEIENDFDYAYVTVSVDEGQTWQPLPGRTTRTDDPQGANLGDGLSGVSGYPRLEPEDGQSGRWVQERMDLTPYAGQDVLLRFWMVNDPAYNAQGLLLDDIRIPEIGYQDGGEAGEGGWQAQGFDRTHGAVPQEWRLRLAVETDYGIEVRRVALDEHNRALIDLAAGERAVLVILGVSPITDVPAGYVLGRMNSGE